MPGTDPLRSTDVLGVGLVAAGALLYEVVLTRIFAVTLWYYFGALAISLAMLGLAVAAVACFVLADRQGDRFADPLLPAASALFALLSPLAVALHLALPIVGHGVADAGFYALLAGHLFALFAVFLAAGLAISAALYRHRDAFARVYAADLAGASLGCALVVPLLQHASAPASVFAVSALGAAGALAFAWPRRGLGARAALASVALAALALGLANDRLELLRVRAIKSYDLASAQSVEQPHEYEQWSPLSRVTVHPFLADVLEVRNDGAAPTYLRRFDGDFAAPALEAYGRDVSQVANRLRRDARVLVIGSGGGKDVLSGLWHGQARITAVEINPVVTELVRGRYADYIGRIFDDPRVTLELREGRNFVAGSSERYDLIVSNMIDSWGGAAAAAGAYIFSENTLYTREAVRDYLAHLAPGGILSVSRHWYWDDALRLVSTFLSVLEETGVPDASARIAVVTEQTGPFRRATVLLQDGAFTREQAESLAEWSRGAATLRLVWVPGLARERLWPDPYAEVFRTLIEPPPGTTRAALLARHPRDLSPSTDDRPFHFFTTRFRQSFRVLQNEHPSRRLALPILYGMFVVFTAFGLAMLVLPLWLTRGGELRDLPRRRPVLGFFALLGVGYLVVEVSLLHRLTVFLGHPTYSFVVVLATMLLASGLGSLGCERLAAGREAAFLRRVLLATTLLLVGYAALYARLIDAMWLSLPARIAVAVLVIAPPAFLMGMCFPLGMSLARRADRRLVPWGWAVNGAFSVLAPIAALALSLNLGLTAALLCGTLCYAFAALLVRSLEPRAA
jgi:spermidine synthase